MNKANKLLKKNRSNKSNKNRNKKNQSKKNQSKKNQSKKNQIKKNRSKKNRSKKNRSKNNKIFRGGMDDENENIKETNSNFTLIKLKMLGDTDIAPLRIDGSLNENGYISISKSDIEMDIGMLFDIDPTKIIMYYIYEPNLEHLLVYGYDPDSENEFSDEPTHTLDVRNSNNYELLVSPGSKIEFYIPDFAPPLGSELPWVLPETS